MALFSETPWLLKVSMIKTKLDILAVTAERTYILPHQALRRAISHYTLFIPRVRAAGSDASGLLNIVPDASGCIVCRWEPANFNPMLWGPTSKVVSVSNCPALIPQFIFVEFRPCGAARLLNSPLYPLENMVTELSAVDGRLADEIKQLFDQSYCGRRIHDHFSFIEGLDKILLKRLEGQKDFSLVSQVMDEVSRSRGALRLAGLSRSTGYSGRHISRVVSEKLGLSVKRLSRIIRINQACRLLSEPGTSLTELAHLLNYHDQAHFIHDFKAVCGLSPGRFLDKMSDFYNEELKMNGIMPSK